MDRLLLQRKTFKILISTFILLHLLNCSQRTEPTTPDDQSPPSASFSWMTTQKPSTAAINNLVKNRNNHLYAATNGNGTLRSTTAGKNWEFYNNGLSDSIIQCLACDSLGNIFAGTYHQGLFVQPVGQNVWIQTDLSGKTIHLLGVNPEGIIFAGSADTVYRSLDDGQTRESLSISLINRPVIYFLCFPGGHIFAGTYARRIIYSNDSGQSWSPNIISPITIISLGSNVIDHILVGTLIQGGLISRDNGLSWDVLQNGFGESAYQFLKNSEGFIFCAGIGDSIRRSIDNGQSWEKINANLTDLYVYSLVLDQEEYLLAGTETGQIYKSNYTSKQRDLPGIA